MAINAVSGSSQLLAQINAGGQVARAGRDRDQDGDGAAASGGRASFVEAIFQALAQSGVSGSGTAASGATAPASAQDPVQALGAFMRNLFAALHGQGSGAASGASAGGSDADGDNDGTTSATGAGRHHAHGGGGLESRLQGLIQQLSATAPADSTQTGLESSFQSLLSALGASAGQATLGGFLQALAQNLHGTGSTGNAVNTVA